MYSEKGLPPFIPAPALPVPPSWVSWVPLGCSISVSIYYYVSIIYLSMVKGPFTISRCLTRLRSPLSASILKSLFSSYSQVFRRTVEYNLGNLLATGLLRSWKKWPWSSFSLTGATFPPTSMYTSFSFEITSCCTQYRVTLGAGTQECWQMVRERISKGLNVKKASVAYTE